MKILKRSVKHKHIHKDILKHVYTKRNQTSSQTFFLQTLFLTPCFKSEVKECMIMMHNVYYINYGSHKRIEILNIFYKLCRIY